MKATNHLSALQDRVPPLFALAAACCSESVPHRPEAQCGRTVVPQGLPSNEQKQGQCSLAGIL